MYLLIYISTLAITLAWKDMYIGNYHELFARSVDDMNAQRIKGDNPYGNYISIVQSSGLGKSRLIREAAGLKFSLIFNVSAADKDG